MASQINSLSSITPSDLLKGRVCDLGNLSALRVSGDDADIFLQGQLSNDICEIKPTIAQLSSLNSPQGRVIAILRVLRDTEGFLLILPGWQIDAVQQHLVRYVLRSNVKLVTQENFKAMGSPSNNPAMTATTGLSRLDFPGNLTEWFGDRVTVHDLLSRPGGSPDDNYSVWKSARILAGIPEITPSTTAQFIAQMLNLDALGGISFLKGCYTGQEIIARTEHRGRIKRRTFIGHCEAQLSGQENLVNSAGAKRGELLEISTIKDKTVFLAVISIDSIEDTLFIGEQNGPAVTCIRPSYLDDET